MGKLEEPSAWLVRSKDETALMRSASGGAFWEIALRVVGEGGVVCGCAWDDDFVARHIVVEDEAGLRRLQGSKYVRSDLGSALSECVDAAASGKAVLFSGTPCQCKALAALAERRLTPEARGRLVIMALICHGTAQPFLWELYKSWLSEEHGGARLVGVCFRDKSEGYGESQCRYDFVDENGDKLTAKWSTYLQDQFMYTTIVYNMGLEKSCYNCACKGLAQPFDLIVGDWYAACEGAGAKGSSCAIALTDLGDRLLQTCFPDKVELDMDEVVERNRPLTSHVEEPRRNRELVDRLKSGNSFDGVERFFPRKYKLKKLLVKVGLFTAVKRMLG